MNLKGRKSSTVEQKTLRMEEEELRERVEARWGFIKTDEHTEALYNANLMRVGADLTRVCHPNGGRPKEIVATYAEVMEELMDWFNIVPLREKLEDMLESKIWSRWSPPEQPVVPLYTPELKRTKRRPTNKSNE